MKTNTEGGPRSESFLHSVSDRHTQNRTTCERTRVASVSPLILVCVMYCKISGMIIINTAIAIGNDVCTKQKCISQDDTALWVSTAGSRYDMSGGR